MPNPTATVSEGAQALLTKSPKEETVGQPNRGLLEPENLSLNALPGPVNNPTSELVLEFSAADGKHLIFRDTNEELKAVYEGPHGAENRPASVSEPVVEELLRNCSGVALKARSETALSSPIFTGTL